MEFFTYKTLDSFQKIIRFLGACAFLFLSTGALETQAQTNTTVPFTERNIESKAFKEGQFIFHPKGLEGGNTFRFIGLGDVWNVSRQAIENLQELSGQVPPGAFEYAIANKISIPAKLVCTSSCSQIRGTSSKEIQGKFTLTFDPGVMQKIASRLPKVNKPQVQEPVVDTPTLGEGLTKFTRDDFVFDRFDAREGVVYLTKNNESYKVSSRQLNSESPRPSVQVMSWASELKNTLPLRVTLNCSSVICSYSTTKDAKGNALGYALKNGKYSWDFDWKIIDRIAQTKYPDVWVRYQDPKKPDTSIENTQDLTLVGADAQNLYFVDKNGSLEKKHVLKKNAVANISDSLLRASGTTSENLKYSITCTQNNRDDCKKSVFVPKDGNDPYYEMKGLFDLKPQPSGSQGNYDPTIPIGDSTLDKLKFQDMNDQYYIFKSVEKIASLPKGLSFIPRSEARRDVNASVTVTYLVPKASVQIDGDLVQDFNRIMDLSEVIPPDLFAYWKAKAQDLQLASIKCHPTAHEKPKTQCKQSMGKADDGSPIIYLTGMYSMKINESNIARLKTSYQKDTGTP